MKYFYKVLFIGAFFSLSSCEDSPVTPLSKESKDEMSKVPFFSDSYIGGFPEEYFVDQFAVVEMFEYKSVDVVFVKRAFPSSYGGIFEFGFFYAKEKNGSVVWWKCLEYGARSVMQAELEVDEENDIMKIIGKDPGTNQKIIIGEFPRFSTSFLKI